MNSKDQKPFYHGHRQRLRDRFLKDGFKGFAPHEVVELLLTLAIPQRDVKKPAHALIERFGSIQGVLAPVWFYVGRRTINAYKYQERCQGTVTRYCKTKREWRVSVALAGLVRALEEDVTLCPVQGRLRLYGKTIRLYGINEHHGHSYRDPDFQDSRGDFPASLRSL